MSRIEANIVIRIRYKPEKFGNILKTIVESIFYGNEIADCKKILFWIFSLELWMDMVIADYTCKKNQQHCDQNFLTKHPITGHWPHVFVLWKRSWKRADFSNYSIVWAGQEGADWIAGGGQRPVFTDDGRLPSERWSPGLYLHLHQQEDPCLCCTGRQERERERQETGGERHCHVFFHLATSPCSWFCGSVTINRVVSFTSHFLNIRLQTSKCEWFARLANKEFNRDKWFLWIMIYLYKCTTQLASHRRAGVDIYFFLQYCFF